MNNMAGVEATGFQKKKTGFSQFLLQWRAQDNK